MTEYLEISRLKTEIIELVTQSVDEDLLDLVFKLLVTQG